MVSTSSPQRFVVAAHDNDTVEKAGELSLSADGQLSVISAEASYQAQLEDIVTRVNAKPSLFLRDKPPLDAEPLELFMREAKRQDADFAQSLVEYLKMYHDLELISLDTSVRAATAPRGPATRPHPPTTNPLPAELFLDLSDE